MDIAGHADVATLRRIALLVVRASEDTAPGPVHDGLVKISSVIDHMKRAIVLGRPVEWDDVVRLQNLVTRLPKRCCDPHTPTELVRSSAIRELRELVSRVDGDVHRAAVSH